MNEKFLPDENIINSAPETWKLNHQAAGCRVCQQVFFIPAGQVGKKCPRCAVGTLEPQPARMRPEPPEKMIPFGVQSTGLRPIFEKFCSGIWLHAEDFTPENLLQHARPLFLPMWLVDCDLAAAWEMEAGFDYQVKSSQEMYASGSWQTRETVENRVRWEPRLGLMQRHYDNVVVPAVHDQANIQTNLGDYSYKQAQTYQPGLVQNTALRIPDLPPKDAWDQAARGIERLAAQECQKASAAQHTRNYTIRPTYENLNWTQLLLPVYISHYSDDDGNPITVWINAQTGKIGGARLASQRKGWQTAGIAALVAIAAFVLGAIMTAAGAAIAPLVLLGVLFILLAVGAFIFAVVAAIYPWQWNRKQIPPKIQTRV